MSLFLFTFALSLSSTIHCCYIWGTDSGYCEKQVCKGIDCMHILLSLVILPYKSMIELSGY